MHPVTMVTRRWPRRAVDLARSGLVKRSIERALAIATCTDAAPNIVHFARGEIDLICSGGAVLPVGNLCDLRQPAIALAKEGVLMF